MKALLWLAKKLWQCPYIIVFILIIGFVARAVVGQCIVNDYNTMDYAVSAAGTDGSGGWLDTRISLPERSQVKIETEGTVYLSSLSATPVSKTVTLNSTSSAWVMVPGVSLRAGDGVSTGDTLKIQMGAKSTRCSTTSGNDVSCGSTPSVVDNVWCNAGRSGCSTNGKNVRAVISPSTPTGSEPQVSLASGTTAATNWGTNTQTDIPNGGYNGKVNRAGNLYLNISDCTSCYGDNNGGYKDIAVTVTPDPSLACKAENGAATTQAGCSGGALKAVISTTNPANGGGTNVNLSNGQFALQAVPSGSNGTLWLRVDDSSYSDNSEAYSVHITSKNPTSSVFSTLINDLLIKPVHATLFNAIPNIYTNLTGSIEVIKAVQVCLILYIIFYAICFTVGLINSSQTDLVIRTLKIGLMLALISPNSWDFFNKRLFLLFIDGGMWLLNNLTGAVGTTSNPFYFVDDVLGQIFNEDMIFKLMAISMTLPVGLLYTLLILDATLTYVKTIFNVILGVAMAMIGLALMLTIAPFCISFILFRDTQQIFRTWLSALFRYAVEPVFVLAGLLVINEMLSIMFHSITDVPVCWGCAFNFTIPGMGLDLCFQFWVPWGYDSNGLGQTLSGLGFTLSNIMIFEILTRLLREYVNYAPRLTAKITGMAATSGTNSFGKVAGNESAGNIAMNNFTEVMKSFIGKDKASKDRREEAEKAAKAAKTAQEQ